MKIVRFTAENAASALAQIHAQLGPEAVVLSVREIPAQGLSRFLLRRRLIEVMAGVPDPAAAAAEPAPVSFDSLRQSALAPQHGSDASNAPVTPGRWRSVAWLESMGLLPEHADRLQSHLRAITGGKPPATIEAEWSAVSGALAHFWLQPPSLEDRGTPRPHVFIGPPGSGKTTVLCKWLTLAVLTEERIGRVWRLDGNTANTAEFMEIHDEMLGVPVERFWGTPDLTANLLFVDMPGVEASDPAALASLRAQIAALPSPRLHLVLNAACEMSVLQAHWQAFASFEPEDLIFTHMDEETRRVKLWNLVFGTNCSVRFLAGGQKIPGEFQRAIPGLLLPAEKAR